MIKRKWHLIEECNAPGSAQNNLVVHYVPQAQFHLYLASLNP